ncbi:MAG: cytidine deaminase [Candidatus Njordarchaeales archaeon]
MSDCLDIKKIQKLIAIARRAAEKAYAPYSKFKVGSLVETDKGQFIGFNIENASYGLTICAERTAIFNAIINGASEFKCLVVYNENKMPYPCGACLQVMSEFNRNGDMIVIIASKNKFEKYRLKDLFPHAFYID